MTYNCHPWIMFYEIGRPWSWVWKNFGRSCTRGFILFIYSLFSVDIQLIKNRHNKNSFVITC